MCTFFCTTSFAKRFVKDENERDTTQQCRVPAALRRAIRKSGVAYVRVRARAWRPRQRMRACAWRPLSALSTACCVRRRTLHISAGSRCARYPLQSADVHTTYWRMRRRAQSTHFIVRNINSFAADVLPLFFSHSNWTSFLRQLTNYGFERASVPEPVTAATDGFVFTHAVFRRGRPDGLPRVVRVRKRARHVAGSVPDARTRATEMPPPTNSVARTEEECAATAADEPASAPSKRAREADVASVADVPLSEQNAALAAGRATQSSAALGGSSVLPEPPLIASSAPSARLSAASLLPHGPSFDVAGGGDMHRLSSEIANIRAQLRSLHAGQQELLHALHQLSSPLCHNIQSLPSVGDTLAMDLFGRDSSDDVFGSSSYLN